MLKNKYSKLIKGRIVILFTFLGFIISLFMLGNFFELTDNSKISIATLLFSYYIFHLPFLNFLVFDFHKKNSENIKYKKEVQEILKNSIVTISNIDIVGLILVIVFIITGYGFYLQLSLFILNLLYTKTMVSLLISHLFD